MTGNATIIPTFTVFQHENGLFYATDNLDKHNRIAAAGFATVEALARNLRAHYLTPDRVF